MGIFDKRKSIPRKELGSIIRKDKGIIPGTGGKKYCERERKEIVKKFLKPGYGSEISKDEFRKGMRDLESEKKAIKNRTDRTQADQQIRYWKQQGGKFK